MGGTWKLTGGWNQPTYQEKGKNKEVNQQLVGTSRKDENEEFTTLNIENKTSPIL